MEVSKMSIKKVERITPCKSIEFYLDNFLKQNRKKNESHDNKDIDFSDVLDEEMRKLAE